MSLKQKLIIGFFSFLVFSTLAIRLPNSTLAAPWCEEWGDGIFIGYEIIPNQGIEIGREITLLFWVDNLKAQALNADEVKVHFGSLDEYSHVCNTYTTPNTGLAGDDSRATGDITAYEPGQGYIFPSIINPTTGGGVEKCPVSLLHSANSRTGNDGEDLCWFKNQLPYPEPRAYDFNVSSPVSVGQQITASGRVNFFNKLVHVSVFTNKKHFLGHDTTSDIGEFSMTLDNPFPADNYTAVLNVEAKTGIYYEIAQDFLQITAGLQSPIPDCGYPGSPEGCCQDQTPAYCHEGTPSSDTPFCICQESGITPGAGNLIPISICKFVGEEGSDEWDKCFDCVRGIQLGTATEPIQGIPTPFGCIPAQPQDFVERLLRISIGIAGGIAFLMILYGGFQIMMSAGNPERLQGGKEIITSAISGLLLIIFSAIILRIIGINILGGFPGFG